MENELTYGERIEAKKDAMINEYRSEVLGVLGTSYLINENHFTDGILNNSFFTETDFRCDIKGVLVYLTKKLRKDLLLIEEI